MIELFPGAQRDLLDTLGRSPAAGLAPDIGESFAATMEANRRTRGILSEQFNQGDWLQDKLDAFERKTGERILNPMTSGATGDERALMLRAARERVRAKAEETNDPALVFPTDDEIARGGLDLARQARRRAADIDERPGGIGATVGSLGADLVGGLTDPLNAIAIAATPSGGPLLMGALRAGLGTAAQ